MKKMRIKAAFITGAIILSLTGCGDSDGSGTSSLKNTQQSIQKTTEAAEIENLKVPANLKWKYDYDSGVLSLNWDAVKGADKYEIMYGDSKTDFEKANSCVLTGVYEGDSGKVKVRAVREQSGQTDYSEWAETSYDIEVNLRAPSSYYYDIDGKYYMIYWDEVPGATEYEISFTDSNGEVKQNRRPNPYVKLSNFRENGLIKGNISVRSIKKVGDREVISKWNNVPYDIPEIKLDDYISDTSLLLDHDSLLKWADNKGYEYSETQDGDITIVDVYFKDKENSGLKDKLGRFGAAAWKAFVSGFIEGGKDKVESDFDGRINTLKTLFTYEGLGDYAKDTLDESSLTGTISALYYGVQALLKDAKIHYIYYYKDKKAGAFCAERILLKKNRENYVEENYSSYKLNDKGAYHVYKPTGDIKQYMDIYVTESKYDEYDYWDIIIYRDKSANISSNLYDTLFGN